jgi:glycerol kinase
MFPAFSGAAAPWWAPRATGVASGLGLETDGEQILAATIYATGMRILDCTEAFKAAGTGTHVLRVSGKLTRLAGLLSTVADAGQLRVEVSKEEETGLLGISRLALAGLEGRVAALEHSPAIGSVVLPRWPEKRALRARRRWRAFARQALVVGSTGSAL